MLLVLAASGALFAPVTAVTWLNRPTGADIARVYPAAALRKNQEGFATITCKVAADGALTACEIAREQPPGQGFGEAALKLGPLFKMTPPGSGNEDPTVRIPIRFSLPGSGRAEVIGKRADVAACYGQVANLAEADASSFPAWRATTYWIGQLINVIAAGYNTPSDLEAAMTDARRAAAAPSYQPPKGSDLAACMAKAPK